MQDDLLNVKEYLLHFYSKWYWFLLSCIVGFMIGYLVYLYQKPNFQVEASLVISNEKSSNSLENFFNENGWTNNKRIDNQIGILKSYTLNRQVLEKLNWRVKWYQTGLFTDVGLYSSQPFQVIETTNQPNPSGVKITIKVTSAETYDVTIDKSNKVGGKRLSATYKGNGKFGTPFSSPWFHFTLVPIDNLKPERGKEYYFTFNDINTMVNQYRKNMVVDLLRDNSEILTLKLKGHEPDRDRDYLNELLRIFIQYGLSEKNKSSENTIRFIDMQLSGISDSLRRSAQKFSDFRSANRIFDLSQEGSIAVDKVTDLESAKSQAELKMDYFQNLQTYIGNAEQMQQLAAPSVAGISDPLFNNLVVALVELYRKREVLSYSANEQSPNMVLIEKEIKMLQKNLNESLKSLMSNTQIELSQIKQRLAQVNREVSKLPGMEQQMISIKGRFEMNNEMNNFLLKKKAEAAITMASNAPDAYVLDAAYPETTTFLGPQKGQYLFVGILLGFILPMLIILIYDFFNDKIRSMEQLIKRTSLPVLGSVAHNNYKTDYPVRDHPRSAIAESFRSLRTNIQFLNPDVDKQIISMHSIMPGEGKTFVSLNIATIFALNNKKVLLVGADLRIPRLQKIMGYHKSAGLSNYLIEQASLDEITKTTDIKDLWFIPAGSTPPNPTELLESNRFDTFLEEIRKIYDIIVFDNAPFSIITDSIVVGNKSDINIVVIRQEFSFKNNVSLMNEVSDKGTLKNIGVVLNDVQESGYGYGKRYGSYSYRYKYGSSYYSDKKKETFLQRLFKRNRFKGMVKRSIWK